MTASLGKITVTSAGTPVRATINESDPTAPYHCHAFLVEAWPTNTGKIYIGMNGMNKTTGVELLAILAVPTANTSPTFSATIAYAPNALTISDIYIDAENSNDGALVSVVIG